MDDLWLWAAALAAAALLLCNSDIRKLMTDYTRHTAQVDATISVMADAVSVIQGHIAELAAAKAAGDTSALDAAVDRLKGATDSLAGVVAAAKAG